ncbi:hypothetical protein [Sphingobacterium sp. UDSM-2020]|uniref:hypothetical protein n=1 Tax=Sphingobacterium sp. UDSM-2020 TaxID=2795738 RepID=UPI001936161A|nr:hypothetical protein [Sphingobacterium sp. UDSM-2020]QQD13141.1 hypothetical protein JAZ75_21505 [Sphingobacterium sp. UDSM-2020]
MMLSEIVTKNLEKQRTHLGLEHFDIDKYSDLDEGTYLGIISGQIELTVNTLHSIVEKVFNSKVKEYLNPKFKAKPYTSLKQNLQKVIQEKNIKISYGPLPYYLTLIIYHCININEEFSNKLFKENLPEIFKERNIEIHKYTLRKNVETLNGVTEEGTHKNFIKFIYKFPLSEKQIEKAKEKVNPKWYKDFSESIIKK